MKFHVFFPLRFVRETNWGGGTGGEEVRSFFGLCCLVNAHWSGGGGGSGCGDGDGDEY